MKLIFKVLLLTTSVLTLTGCTDLIDKFVDIITPQDMNAPISANINEKLHQSQTSDDLTTLERTAKGHYYFCCHSRIITSEDGHQAQICLKFNDDVDISEFRPFTKYTIKAIMDYDLEPGEYKTYETSDGWIEFTYIKEHQREVFRLEGKFEFVVKDPDSGQILICVTNGKFDLPILYI